MELSNKILSDITVYMKYAKFVPELNRRETWEELVTRNRDMHIKKYPKLKDEIKEAYERQGNGKGEYRNRGNKKILNIKYTPDFIGSDFIIECKGRANESFPIRWKLFKAYVHKHLPNITLYKPQNQKECEETVNLILSKRKT